MIDRKVAPETHTITEIPFQEPEIITLENGAKLFCIRETNDLTVHIDFVFDAGSLKASKLIAFLTGDLLLSGTKDKTSDEIEEQIDYLGGYTEVGTTTERSRVTVFGLEEHIVEITETLIDALLNVNFSKKEIKQLIQEKRKKMAIQLQKVNVQAKRAFMQEVFAKSPYGIIDNIEDFDNINRQDIIDFYRTNYLSGLKYISIVGDLNDQQLDALKKLGNKFNVSEPVKNDFDYSYTPKTIHIDKKNAVQTAIRVGKVFFNKRHPDYKKFIILNTILGGYFGSRLMTSIREDKGYTYGIGSSVIQYLDTGYFYISSEVATEFAKPTLEAIKHEIELLQTVEVSEEELSLVKNYLIGEVLEQSDGAQAMMDRFISVHVFDLSLSYYNDLIHEINEITAAEIKALAQKYLNWEDFTIVTVG